MKCTASTRFNAAQPIVITIAKGQWGIRSAPDACPDCNKSLTCSALCQVMSDTMIMLRRQLKTSMTA